MIEKNDILVKQEKIGNGVYVAAIIAMMTVQWMTLDMYLPALPVLKEQFGASEAMLNMSLNSDLCLCAIGTLIGGTLSDKYGRNPVMLVGLVMATVSLLLAGFANGVTLLIIMRGISGFGGGISLAIATAMVRDSFKGKTFRTITTVTQAAAIIGPFFAPAIGAFFLEFFSWRWIFIALGCATIITAIPFIIATETWPKEKRNVESVWQATVQSFNIARNGNFIAMASVMMILSIPMWAYLATCSYIYYDFFHVNNVEYSILYAIGTVFSFVAPFIYGWLSSRIKGRFIVDIILVVMAIATILLLIIGTEGPVLFLVAIVPIMMAEAMIRPMTMVIVLEEYPNEAGSASSVTGFAQMMIALPATAIATLQWSSFVYGLTVITGVCTIATVILWMAMIKKKVYSRQLGIR